MIRLLFFQMQVLIIAPLPGCIPQSHGGAAIMAGFVTNRSRASANSRHSPRLTAQPTVATRNELSDFLRQAEKKAFKRALYHVRDDEAALDIVQDSMIKLSTHYGDKPVQELPLLFQRILSNTILDWFRRQKTRRALFTNLPELGQSSDGEAFDWLEVDTGAVEEPQTQSAESHVQQWQTLSQIEEAIQSLPARQREAFLLRYWEELDVAETAAVMGCTEGSVKTHCSRAVAALSKRLAEQGIQS